MGIWEDPGAAPEPLKALTTLIPLAAVAFPTKPAGMQTAAFFRDLFGLEGQTAVVIGGTGELCGCMAQGLAHAGAEVVLVGRIREKAERKLAEIEEFGGKGYFMPADVTSRESLQELVHHVVERSATWSTSSCSDSREVTSADMK